MTVLAVFMATVTAYCGYTGHLTASGTVPRPGVIAAPAHVPFGTTYWVEGYGLGVVEDRGGAIVGNRLDIYFYSCSDAIRWGRRSVPVSLLGAVPVSPVEDEPSEETE